jgi:hypothetical protein
VARAGRRQTAAQRPNLRTIEMTAGRAARGSKAHTARDNPTARWEVTMLTVLLIIIIVLLLTGGGFGYSRRGRGL